MGTWLASTATGLRQLELDGLLQLERERFVISGASHLQALPALAVHDIYMNASHMEGIAQLPGLRELRLAGVWGGFLGAGFHSLTRLTRLQLDCAPHDCLEPRPEGPQDVADVIAQVEPAWQWVC